MHELKIYREVMRIDTKYYETLAEELTYCFKIDMRNFANFDPSTQKSQKFAL